MDAMELSLDGLSLDLDQVSSPLSSLATGTCAHDVAVQRQAGAAMAACFRSLTNDCLVSIFRYLRPWPDLASASQVCRRFAQLLTRHRSLWAHLELTGSGSHRHHGALPPVSDRVILALARRAGPALRRITVRGCAALSVGGVAEALTQGGAAAVSAVELADCPGLGVAAVVSCLAAACGGLRSLSMSGFRARPSAGESEETCDGVSTAEVAQPLCQLTHCRLEDCYLSGAEELAATLRQLGPQLQHLEIVVAGVAAREDRSVAAHLVDVVAASPAVEQLRVLQLGELTSRSAQWTDSLSLSMMMEDSMDSGRGSTAHPSGNSGGIGMLLLHDGVASTPDSCVEALFRRCSSGSLETLELAGFRGLVGSALEHAPRSLQELSMRGCSGLTSLPLPSCKSLTTISLEGCSALADAAIISVGRQCPTLTELNVEGCEQLSDSAMEAAVVAGGFRHLKRLNLRGCQQLTSTTLASVAHASCGQLVHVAAGFDRMSVLSLNMPSVESSYAGVEDDAWRWLAPVDNEGVVMLATTCSLAFLDISGCRITGSAILDGIGNRQCATACSLVELRIASCPGLRQIDSLAANSLPSLTSLTVASCQGLGDSDLSALVSASPILHNLCVDDCSRITGTGVGFVGMHCRQLSQLYLVQCDGIEDDVTFSDISTLQQLSLLDCANISAVSALVVIVACGSLWRTAGSIRIERCAQLMQLKESLPKALMATVRSFSAGASDDVDQSAQLVPMIVKAMARVEERA